MTHPVLRTGRTAVVTGAASGIGFAAARRFARIGMNVCLVDTDEKKLEAARADIEAAGGTALAVTADVADSDRMEALKDEVYTAFGAVALLMNNAVTRIGGGVWGDREGWRRAMDVNFWGVENGVRAFAPAMIAQGTPAMIVNVSSKQGITNPPGNTVYNITKAALKVYTEALEHEFRNTDGCHVSAHLLVPGMTTTGEREHRPGAWWPDQVIDVLLPALERGDFYIVCPDGEVTPEMDRKRMLWAAGDVTENRPALSRWHRDYKEAFAKFSP